MPGMSGPDLQQELMTRRQDDPDRLHHRAAETRRFGPRCLSRGAVECLFKPFSEAALLDALNAALRMR